MFTKLKPFIPYLLIALLVGWFSYKFFVERKLSPEAQQQKMTLDWDQLDTSSKAVTDKDPATINQPNNETETKVREYSALTPSEKDEFAVFDEIEKKWLLQVKTIIGSDYYTQYLSMRERNEKEKMEAYKEYHDYLRAKHGDKFTYNISEDQSIREKKINQIYLKELMRLIGEEKFKVYLKARDKMNEDNRRRHKEFIQVEF